MRQVFFVSLAVVLLVSMMGCQCIAPYSESCFENPLIEAAVRQKLQKEDGNLTSQDLLSVRSLSLVGHSIDLKDLILLPNLEYLFLEVYDLTDLSPIAVLTQLKFLDIESCGQLIDISSLSHLTCLEKLYITKCPVQDISAIASLVNLKTLDLSYTRVTDITPIAKLIQLEELSLRYVNIDSITPLNQLSGLKKLDLYETPQPDIQTIIELSSLKELTLPGFVDDESVALIRKALPYCDVHCPKD